MSSLRGPTERALPIEDEKGRQRLAPAANLEAMHQAEARRVLGLIEKGGAYCQLRGLASGLMLTGRTKVSALALSLLFLTGRPLDVGTKPKDQREERP